MNPESSDPYHEFLKGFAIPEVYSAMGILYSISIGNSGNADKQISELVDKNLELLDATERDMLRRQAGGMQVLFLLPVLTASGRQSWRITRSCWWTTVPPTAPGRSAMNWRRNIPASG